MGQKDLRGVRAVLGLSGSRVCVRVGFSRTKLCHLERGDVLATSEELSSIAATLKDEHRCNSKGAVIEARNKKSA